MYTTHSFTRIEKKLLPKFRNQMSTAESTEDVKKFFSYCIKELFSLAFAGVTDFGLDNFLLAPEKEPPFEVSQLVLSDEAIAPIWQHSDLPDIIGRFAQVAVHRHLHLTKVFEKTEAKTRMEG